MVNFASRFAVIASVASMAALDAAAVPAPPRTPAVQPAKAHSRGAPLSGFQGGSQSKQWRRCAGARAKRDDGYYATQTTLGSRPSRRSVSGDRVKARSDVIVNTSNGHSFQVTHARPDQSRRAAASGTANATSVDDNGPSGTIDLMTQNDAGLPKKLGSLFMNTNKSPVELDASDRESSTVYVVPDPNVEASADANIKFVQLHYLVTDAQNLTVVPWCATYDSTPDHPAPMTILPCRNSTEKADPSQSQSFMFTIDTGVVTPLSALDADADTDASVDVDSKTDASANKVAAPEAVMESATHFRVRADAALEHEHGQNVTLVFHPSDAPQPIAHNLAAAEDDHPFASTVTETVTVTASASSTASVSADSAASPAPTSSGSSAKASQASFDAMDVEVFPGRVQASQSASVSGSASISAGPVPTASPSASSSVSNTPTSSASVDADAVASEVANGPPPASEQMSRRLVAVGTDPYKWTFKRDN